MSLFFIPAISVIVSMAIIPLMMRYATALGMVDEPEERKVHEIPVPRVGGWGMVLGSTVSLFLFLEIDAAIGWYLFGSLVLLGFGAKDDQADIGHYPKFLGQFLAVIPLVVFGGVQVERLPFIDDPLSPWIGIPFTVFAMVGAINALNHSDGLDGLAGGEATLSLCALTMVGITADTPVVTAVALAGIGGILGFLRFNTHPAKVFMGDAGSQFLGFTLAFLTVYLVQVNDDLSVALPALLLGLPIIDILAVFWQRAYQGLNWFKATKNHIHHRLLDLGFEHYESVVIIYGIQAFFVVSAIFLQHASNALILGLYLGTCTLVFAMLMVCKARNWRAHRGRTETGTARRDSPNDSPFREFLGKVPVVIVSIAVPVYVLGSCTFIDAVPWDYGWTAIALFILLLVESVRSQRRTTLGRIAIYATALFVLFLTVEASNASSGPPAMWEFAYFCGLALAIAFGVRFSSGTQFSTTPLDYLVLFSVVLIALFPLNGPQTEVISILVIEGFIILYGCELLLNRARSNWTPLTLASLGALAIIGLRGTSVL